MAAENPLGWPSLPWQTQTGSQVDFQTGVKTRQIPILVITGVSKICEGFILPTNFVKDGHYHLYFESFLRHIIGK